MIRRLLSRIGDRLMRTEVPATWRDDPALDACVARHPAGKRLTPGDPSP